MTRPIVAAVLAVALCAAPASPQSDKPPVSFGRAAGQVGIGTLALPVGFVVGGVVSDWVAGRVGLSDDSADDVAIAGAWTGAALATAGGAAIMGSRGSTTGSFGAAVAGAAIGGMGSYLLVRLNDRDDEAESRPCRLVCVVSAIGVVILPSVGATVGYNLSRRYER